jgi:DNA-directed RNA polymerase specialized sigma24 family protein
MRAEEQFDSFYLKSRRALVHQTFALTGDLAAADRAVRDAYVSAWHHWRKVKAHDDPRDWVRPRAWAQAQRRHTARLWHRTRDLSAEDRAVLDALHRLTSAERRAVLMVHLAGVPADVAARELNVTQETLEKQAEEGALAFASALGEDASSVKSTLMRLGQASSQVSLPRPAAIRREGRARRRTHTVVAAAATTFLALGSGAFAHESPDSSSEAGPVAVAPEETEPSRSPSPPPESKLPSADDLLLASDLKPLKAKGTWRVVDTHDNTAGEGINYPCQQERFADPDGLATLVRQMEVSGKPESTVVQSVEISASADEAGSTYATVLSWFAGCTDGMHLRETYRVAGVGERAMMFEMETWGAPRTVYSVGVAQVGQVVSTTVVRRVDAPMTPGKRVAGLLAQTAEALCERAGGTDCTQSPELKFSAPQPTGETRGVLATVDLPPLTEIRRPWVGTNPAPAPQNPARTSCDRAEFRQSGAVRARTRTFLVPEANLPDHFGLTETYGTFKTKKAAKRFMDTVRKRFANCEDRELATSVMAPNQLREGPLDGSTWRLRTELSENRDVRFDVGFVRRGNAVAQLLFVPTEKADLRPGEFRRLVIRAGQRLGELE